MKANHISQAERVRHRVNNLKAKISDPWEPIGKPNPYNRCIGCGISQPEASHKGHYSGCWVKGVEKEIKHYEGVLYEGPVIIKKR